MNFYSQFGEDRWCHENLSLPKVGTFIEVGAFDGRLCSNTLWLEELGWDGFVCEPDPIMAARCRETRKCHVFECAVGAHGGVVEFHVNTADRGMSGLRVAGVPLKVIMQPLSMLIASRNIATVDLLSIDTEGTETDVLDGMGNYRPKVIIAEFWTQPAPPNPDPLVRHLMRDGYREVHRTPANLIFVGP